MKRSRNSGFSGAFGWGQKGFSGAILGMMEAMILCPINSKRELKKGGMMGRKKKNGEKIKRIGEGVCGLFPGTSEEDMKKCEILRPRSKMCKKCPIGFLKISTIDGVRVFII